MARNQQPNPNARTLIIFSCSVIALILLVLATQVEMPAKAILIGIAFSELLFVLLFLLGPKLPDKRR